MFLLFSRAKSERKALNSCKCDHIMWWLTVWAPVVSFLVIAVRIRIYRRLLCIGLIPSGVEGQSCLFRLSVNKGSLKQFVNIQIALPSHQVSLAVATNSTLQTRTISGSWICCLYIYQSKGRNERVCQSKATFHL